MKKLKLQSNSSALLYIQILKITVLVILYFLVSMFSLSAQTPREESGADGLFIKPLKVGDTIPESLWDLTIDIVNAPSKSDSFKLSQFRDKKLIIIDFWATWCSPCINSIHKLDSLQPIFKDELAVFATSYEERGRVNAFLKKQGIKLFSGTKTEYLKQYFPHKMIPHQVWIKNGKIIAITEGSNATGENIRRALKDDSFKLATKNDRLDFSTSRYLADFIDTAKVNSFAVSTFSSGEKGLGSIISQVISQNKIFVNYTNADPISMFMRTLQQPNNKTIVTNRKLLEIDRLPGMEAMFCYQLISKDTTRSFWVRRVLNDLSLQFDVKMERKLVVKDCIIIGKLKGSNIKDSITNFGHPQDFQDFVKLLNFSVRWKVDQPLFIDESGFTGKVIMPYYKELQFDLNKLNQALRPYGLIASKKKRKIDMLILADNNTAEIKPNIR
ncbi:TlpA family protein disulfide reductase [Sphingobacterium multivorum]|uniref:TlpA family protein disulfide reductase n=1 Tax=Sphingobacterium multivorum TaxID=28454 RepID=UPI00345E4DE1